MIKSISKAINLFIIKLFLSKRLRNRADKYLKRSIKEFKHKYHKKPNRDEMFSLVVKSSHRTLGIKIAKGRKGHYKRQRVRKYLLLKHNIRDKYKIQKHKR